MPANKGYNEPDYAHAIGPDRWGAREADLMYKLGGLRSSLEDIGFVVVNCNSNWSCIITLQSAFLSKRMRGSHAEAGDRTRGSRNL